MRATGFTLSPLTLQNSQLDWGDCEDEELQTLGAVCGLLEVPLDHSRPDGEQIQLAVDSGGGPLPPLTPITAELEKLWLDRTEAYANACKERGGELLDFMHTTDVALDLDRIRAAIHSPKLNFYAYSYGSYIAQVYATKFPERVGRMVLDSNIDPSGDWYKFMLDYPVGTNKTLVAWRTWLAQHDDYYHLGATQAEVEKAFDATSSALLEAPAGGVVGPTEWGSIFLGVAYSQDAWPYFGELWKNWLADGDPAPLVTEYGEPADDNSHAVQSAVTCTDMIWPSSWSKWREDTWAIYEQAPRAWGMTWYSAPCLFWQGKAEPAVEIVGEGVAPILLLGETEDGVTPFSYSLAVRRRFPSATLIGTVGGTSHGYSPTGNPCVDDPLADYLLRGTLPSRVEGDRADVLCDAQPLPEPEPPVEEYVYGERSTTTRHELRRRILERHTHP